MQKNQWKGHQVVCEDMKMKEYIITEHPDYPYEDPKPQELIRCKDCKHKDPENGFCHGRGWPEQLVPDDGFCDKGKRKDSE